MKRSGPLKRKTRTRRRETAAMDAYCETHNRCFVTFLMSHQIRDPFRRIEFHHLMGRNRNECHDPRNLFPLEGRLHRHLHSGGEFDDINGDRLPELLPGHLIWCKREQEPELFDPEFLCWLRGWKGFPEKYEPCPLPAVFYLERNLNA